MATYFEIAQVLKSENAKDRFRVALLKSADAVTSRTQRSIDDYRELVFAESVPGRIGELIDIVLAYSMKNASLQALAGSLIAGAGVLTALQEAALDAAIQAATDTILPALARKLINNQRAIERAEQDKERS